MWRRGSRTSALDRAQALLSARRSSNGDGHTGAVGRSAAPNTQTVLSDVSDLSSVSSAPKYEADTVCSLAPDKSQGGYSTKDLRPQSSLGCGGNRFLKRAPPPAPSGSQSPVRGNLMQQDPDPGYVSSSRLGSQTAAKSRLDQIEMRIRSRQQALKEARRGSSPQPEAVLESPEASRPVSSQSSSDQTPKGRHFIKNKAAVSVDSCKAAPSGSTKDPDVGITSKSRDVGRSIVPPAALERKTLRVVSGVSLESDEEDMRKLLGDSLDSSDDSLLRRERPVDKMLSKSSQKVQATPTSPPAAVCPSSPSHAASPPSLAPASRRGSPFRFTGQAQAHFSPSVLSPSPSPPRVSPSPQRRLRSPRRAASPPRSLSSMSGCSEVLSLEELFPARRRSEDPHSEMSFASSEDFKINVMTLDDLVPATIGFRGETQRDEREVKRSAPVPGASSRHQLSPRPSDEVKEEEQQQEEDMLDYQSDFESESKTGPNYSASQVSEYLQGDRDQVEEVSEALNFALSHQKTEDDYSSSFSDATSRTSDGSQTSQSFSGSRDSHSSRTLYDQPQKLDSTRKVLKEAAVQTQANTMTNTWTIGMAAYGPPLGMTYINPVPVSAEKVETLSSFNPAFVLNEMLKQQFDVTKRFIERNRQLHSSLLQSLEPPNYRYTTLKDTKEYIRKHRSPKLTVEEALEEVLQEMRRQLPDS